jgi:hypothetical protein
VLACAEGGSNAEVTARLAVSRPTVTKLRSRFVTRRWRTVTVYAITSLTFEQASPARLADYIRGHRAIENGLHYLRGARLASCGTLCVDGMVMR